jgi:Transposase
MFTGARRSAIEAFHAMVRAKAETELDAWIERSRASLVASFANAVTKDKAAVRTAIASVWSNGQTEGQITKLKLVKRQMYGRKTRSARSAPHRSNLTESSIKIASEPILQANLHCRSHCSPTCTMICAKSGCRRTGRRLTRQWRRSPRNTRPITARPSIAY